MGAASGASAGLEMVGTIMQMFAAKQEAEAMKNSVENELRRQAGFRQSLQPYVVGNINSNSPANFNASMQAGAEQSAKDYSAAGSVAPSVAAYAPEDNPILKASAQQDQSNANILKAAAQLQGLKQATLGQSLGNMALARKQAPIANFARGWENILPLQLNADQHSAADLMAIGQITAAMGGAGANVAAVYGNGAKPQANAAAFQPVTGDYGAGYGSQFGNIA